MPDHPAGAPRGGYSAETTLAHPIPPVVLARGCSACEGTGWVSEAYEHLPAEADPLGVSMPCQTPGCGAVNPGRPPGDVIVSVLDD